MKVVRSFYDYYDGVLGQFAVEQVPLYIRKSEYVDNAVTAAFVRSMEFPRFNLSVVPKSMPGSCSPRRVDMDYAVFGFCGKVYPVYLMWGLDKNPECAYVSADDVRTAYDDVHSSVWWSGLDSFGLVDGLVKHVAWKKLFVELNTPVFVYSPKYGFQINPVMKDYGMVKLFHPYTVVQELEMFFNNDLCVNNTPPMPVGDDKVIAASKGFDKYSFRKLPEKR